MCRYVWVGVGFWCRWGFGVGMCGCRWGFGAGRSV